MPSHTEEERRKNTVITRIGQPNTGRIDNIQSEKVLEQPLVRSRNPIGAGIRTTQIDGTISTRRTKQAPQVSLALPSAPGGISTSRKRGTQAIQALQRGKAQIETFKDLKPIRIDLAAGKAPLDIAKRGPVPFKFKPRDAVAKGGIRTKPGGLGRFAGLISLRKTLTTRKAAGIKGRRAEIKSINESINVLVKQLDATALTGSEDQNTKITEQIEALSTERSNLFAGGGSRGGGANFDTPEGFAAFLASKNIPPEERLSLTRRLFANGP